MKKPINKVKKSGYFYFWSIVWSIVLALWIFSIAFQESKSKDSLISAIIFSIILAFGFYKAFKAIARFSDKFNIGKNSNIFGKARFSKIEEVIEAGLQGAGIVFGKMEPSSLQNLRK
jgi:type IV secretory pathway TraG/TraD family ATPase VirD4